MTAGTFGLIVFSEQLEIGQQVIEAGFIQAKNICVSTFVISMTARTPCAGDGVGFAVKTTVAVDIVCHIFMAITAQCRLPGALKGNVA
jgi:hypothetical protein